MQKKVVEIQIWIYRSDFKNRTLNNNDLINTLNWY